MAWIIFTGLVAIVTAVCIIVFLIAKPTSESDTRYYAFGTGAVVCVIWFVITILLSYNTVGQLQVGLVYSYNGKLEHRTGSGVTVWLLPYQNLKTENIGLQTVEFNLGNDNSAVSADQQKIFADLQLNYEVEPDDVVNLYKTVGGDWKNVLLEGRMLQDFKQVTSTYTAAQITTERAALRADTRAAMVKELQPYGVKIVDVLIKNLGYSDQYSAAITEKTIQVQKALQAKAKVAQATYEADQAIATAKGKAESNLLVAKAQAKALSLKGEAIRKNPEVLQLEAIDKLNPNASIVICTGTGQGNCPSFLPTASTTAGGGK